MRHMQILIALLCAALLSGCSQSGGVASFPTVTTITTPGPATPVARPTSAATQQGAPNEIAIRLQAVASNLNRPVYVTHAGDGSGRLFVVQKAGRIVILRNGQTDAQPFLDISDRVGADGSEQGLLSVAFHPQYRQNGRLFVNYTDRAGDTIISRFQASGDTADPTSEHVLLKIDQPYPNHNGGLVLFGPDGYLYIGMGDGGAAGDPQGNGQNPQALLGKMLRIDVNGDAYTIPPSNPWADGSAARPEVWAIGLRNPWRFSFDRATGDLYIADVGQNAYEEVHVQPADSTGGENYGWNIMEGQHCFRARTCSQAGLILPVAEYSHDAGCSITGGYVYRGQAFPQLNGVYIFGDYCSGQMWSLRASAPGSWQQAELLQSGLQISSFGEDEAGELYLTSLGDNTLYRIVAQA